MSLWRELKRRSVFKVGAAYAVIAWLLIQIAATILPIFEAPAWIAQAFTLVVILGFPIALVLSWAYELTPDGIERTTEASPADSQRPSARPTMSYTIIGLLLVAVAYFVVTDFVLDPRSPRDASATPAAIEASREVLPNSIAVLPLDNLSPDPQNAFIADGLHDELIGQLQKISDLTVIARSAVQRYAGDDRPMIEIADELNVRMLMTGAVRLAGDAVRVSAEVVDPETEGSLDSVSFTGDLSDLFLMQADIAGRIVSALRAQILPAERDSIGTRQTSSDEAYFLYLQAKASVPEPSPVTDPDLMAQIHRWLDEAIELDQSFAEAHALKAMHYASSTQGVLRVADPLNRSERERRTRQHAQRALAIDPGAGLAYAALGRMNESFLREEEAEAAYLQAYELTPNDPDLLIDYGGFSARRGNRDDTIRLARQLAERSPGYGHFVEGSYLCWVGECEDAVASFETALRLTPDDLYSRTFLGITELALGNDARVRAEIEIADRLLGDAYVPPLVLANLAYAYGRLGRPEAARRLVTRLETAGRDYALGDATLALAHLALGERESALQRLAKAADNRNPDEGFMVEFLIKWNYYRDPELDEPDFAAIRERLGY